MSEHGPSGPTGTGEPAEGAAQQPAPRPQPQEGLPLEGDRPSGATADAGTASAPTTPQPSLGVAGQAQQRYPTTPYGQPSYGQQLPYGQSPYAQPQYGQPAPGQSQPGQAQGTQSYWGPPRMPTTPVPYGSPAPVGPGPLPTAAPAARRGGRFRIALAGLAAGALIGGAAGAGVVTLADDGSLSGGAPVAAQNVVIENPETATTATAAAAKAAPSVVTIYVSGESGSGSGSGVVLTEDGYVLTNNHVVAGEDGNAGAVQVRTSDGTLYDAEIVGTDPASDLAVVRLDGAEGLTSATFADSDEVQVGDVAVAIGAPLGLTNTVTDGIVSATGRAVATGQAQDEATVIDAIQTDAAINPGNSGGALVNGAGEVIGINTAIATVASGSLGSEGQSGNIGVGFAIPSNTAKRIGEELMANGEATRAFLGVSARTATGGGNREVGSGAEVVEVTPDSAAADAGIEIGDVVTAIGDRPVTTSTELTAAVRSQAPGERVELTIRRGGSTRTVEVTLGETS